MTLGKRLPPHCRANGTKRRGWRAGESVDSFDALNTAHALWLDMVLVTHNVRKFGRVDGLRIEEWLTPEPLLEETPCRIR